MRNTDTQHSQTLVCLLDGFVNISSLSMFINCYYSGKNRLNRILSIVIMVSVLKTLRDTFETVFRHEVFFVVCLANSHTKL